MSVSATKVLTCVADGSFWSSDRGSGRFVSWIWVLRRRGAKRSVPPVLSKLAARLSHERIGRRRLTGEAFHDFMEVRKKTRCKRVADVRESLKPCESPSLCVNNPRVLSQVTVLANKTSLD